MYYVLITLVWLEYISLLGFWEKLLRFCENCEDKNGANGCTKESYTM